MLVQHGRGVRPLRRPGHLLMEFHVPSSSASSWLGLGAVSPETSAATSLARLQRDQGKRNEARDLARCGLRLVHRGASIRSI